MAWLKAQLGADALLAAQVGTRIFAGTADQGTAYPLVEYRQASGVDINAVGGHRVCVWPLFDVQVIGTNGPAALQAAADRVDAALVQREVVEVVIGGVTYEVQCLREGTIAYDETADGIRYDHIGGRYRLWCRVKP